MEIKIKKLQKEAVIPSYALNGDAGMDLTATSKHFDEFGNVHYGTGLAFKLPENHVGLLFPRSSNAKKDLVLSNSVGVLDSNYIGEVSFKFKPSGVFWENTYNNHPEQIGVIGDSFDKIIFPNIEENQTPLEDYQIGDRIGQLIILPYPKIEFIEVDELGETNRGGGSYGSTGK